MDKDHTKYTREELLKMSDEDFSKALRSHLNRTRTESAKAAAAAHQQRMAARYGEQPK